MRLFVSINLPERFNGCFRELQGKLSGEGLKHAGRKSGFHLTLFFLGEVSDEVAREVGEALRNIHFKPFKLKFSEKLGCFFAGDNVKSVFVDIDRKCEGYAKLMELQKNVEGIVGKFGFKDSREFKPHITLSRVDGGVRGVEECLVEAEEFEVDEFYLMRSRLGKGGSEYEEIERR